MPGVKSETPAAASPIDFLYKPYVFQTGLPPLSYLGCPAEIYLPYYGTYTIESESVIIHHCVGSLFTSWVGMDLKRGYKFLPNGDLEYNEGGSFNGFRACESPGLKILEIYYE